MLSYVYDTKMQEIWKSSFDLCQNGQERRGVGLVFDLDQICLLEDF